MTPLHTFTLSQFKGQTPELWTEWQELVEERAAIMEYDGGLPRHEAEARAVAEVIARMQRDSKAKAS